MMEKWKEIYTEEQLQKLQSIELENLSVLSDVCKKIGVDFFAYGGTLIGAIRHNGFIPWDDDLDVAMTRENYIRFIEEAPKYLPDEYYLQTPYQDKATPYSYTKLRLKGTACIEYINSKLDIEKGIYVDIYPIDNLPDDDALFYKQYRRFHRLAVAYAWRQCPYIEQQGRSIKGITKKYIKKVISVILRMIPQGYYIERMDRISTQYNSITTQRKGNLYYPKPVNCFWQVYPLKVHEFDGQTINIPSGWDMHLRSRYGDYMSLPPDEKRIGHKPYLLDFGKF